MLYWSSLQKATLQTAISCLSIRSLPPHSSSTKTSGMLNSNMEDTYVTCYVMWTSLGSKGQRVKGQCHKFNILPADVLTTWYHKSILASHCVDGISLAKPNLTVNALLLQESCVPSTRKQLEINLSQAAFSILVTITTPISWMSSLLSNH